MPFLGEPVGTQKAYGRGAKGGLRRWRVEEKFVRERKEMLWELDMLVRE